MIEPETQIRAVGFHSREGQGYISRASAFPFYCSLLLKDSEGAKVHLLILLPAKRRHCYMLGSLQFSHSNCLTLWSHGLQHARFPSPSWTPGACSNSCPSSWWCRLTISSSVVSFSPCLQSSPASGSYPMSQFFASGGQRIGVSISASVLPMNIQERFSLGLTGRISLQSKGLSRVFFKAQFKSINSSVLSFLYSPNLTSIHDYWKSHSFD